MFRWTINQLTARREFETRTDSPKREWKVSVVCNRVTAVLISNCFLYIFIFQSADLLQVYGGQMDMIFSVHVNNGRVN